MECRRRYGDETAETVAESVPETTRGSLMPKRSKVALQAWNALSSYELQYIPEHLVLASRQRDANSLAFDTGYCWTLLGRRDLRVLLDVLKLLESSAGVDDRAR